VEICTGQRAHDGDVVEGLLTCPRPEVVNPP
jgi:hypothetical protein